MAIPYLTATNVIAEIQKRTGIPAKNIHSVLTEFFDIVRESIIHGVEVRFKGVGAFTFRENYPMKNVMAYDPARHCKRIFEVTDGYRVPKFRFTQDFRSAVKKASFITYDEFWGTKKDQEEVEVSDDTERL